MSDTEQVSQKLTKSKDVVAYLAEQFPACFNLTGEAKPLKIGIFDDLATRLETDERVSKTRLRTALRHYTNSWRYLRAVKAGVERVDLDGKPAGIVEEGHQQHAEEELAASKAKAAEKASEKRKAEAGKNKEATSKARQQRAKTPAKAAAKAKPAGAKAKAAEKVKPAPKLAQAELSQLKAGQQVQVKVGKSPMPGQVVSVEGEDIQVQLENGLIMKVKTENIFFS